MNMYMKLSAYLIPISERTLNINKINKNQVEAQEKWNLKTKEEKRKKAKEDSNETGIKDRRKESI